MTQKTNRQILDEIHTTVTEIRVTLFGVKNSSDKGLIGDVQDNTYKIEEIDKSHRSLSKRFAILIAFLIGSGALGVGIWGIFNGG